MRRLEEQLLSHDERMLTSTFIYHMSMYLFPQIVLEKLDKQRRTFLWQEGGQKRKYHLVRWETIWQSKKKGGLGVKDIQKMNLSLLCKWWLKLENEKGIWQELVTAKYLKDKTISSVTFKLGDSRHLLKVKLIYIKGRKLSVRKWQVYSVLGGHLAGETSSMHNTFIPL